MNWQTIARAKPLLARHYKEDFAAFCRAAWPYVNPGAKLSWTTGHDAICDHLVAVYRKQVKRLIINCPPRYAKSTIATVLFPIWCWLQKPSMEFLCASYEIDLALNHNQDRRQLMETAWFRDLFADVFQLSTERSQAGEFQNQSGGTMRAVSVNSRAQGRGGDIIVVDDPLSADAAYSASTRQETNHWFENQLPQRQNHPSESAIIVIMQRLHQDDPTGFLLSQENSEWTLLKLPLVAEESETIRFFSGRIWNRPKGDVLDARRWTAATIKQRQRNRLVWAGQFQQSPMAAEGNVIKIDDLRYFNGRDPVTGVADAPLPEHFDRKILSVDCSFKATTGSDYVAAIIVGVLGSRRYLLHVTNARLDLTGTENEIRYLRAVHGPISATLVEETGNGASVIARLKNEIPGLIAIHPEGGKLARLVAASPEFSANDWYLDRTSANTTKVIEQLTMFPNCKFDDIADAISQASIWLQSNSAELGLVAFLKREATKLRAKLFGKKEKQISEVTQPGTALRQVDQEVWTAYAKDGTTPRCPACKNTSTRINSAGRIFCNQCHAEDGVPPAKPEDGCKCGHYLQQNVSGMKRCGNCGW